MDAVAAVLGFDTHDQIATRYNIFRHVSLKNQNKSHLAYSDQYKLIAIRDVGKFAHLGMESTEPLTNATVQQKHILKH